jgi:hypothetical protein
MFSFYRVPHISCQDDSTTWQSLGSIGGAKPSDGRENMPSLPPQEPRATSPGERGDTEVLFGSSACHGFKAFAISPGEHDTRHQ